MDWNPHLKDDELIELSQLRRGDILVANHYDGVSFGAWHTEWTVVDPKLDEGTVTVEGIVDNVTRRVIPSNKVWVRKRKELSPAKKPDSRWNGKCKCGGNTYSSCFSVEHEGRCTL